MSGPNFKLDDNLATVIISFPTAPPVAIELDTSGVTSVLDNIGNMRAHMTPPFEEEWPLGQSVEVVSDPRWSTEPDLMMGNSLIHLRDPRFGWLHYMLPRDEARKLGEMLIKQADHQPPQPVRGKGN